MKLVLISVVLLAINCQGSIDHSLEMVPEESPLRSLGIVSVVSSSDGLRVQQQLRDRGELVLGTLAFDSGGSQDAIRVDWAGERYDLARDGAEIVLVVDGADPVRLDGEGLVATIGTDVPMIAQLAPELGAPAPRYIELVEEQGGCHTWGTGGEYWSWQNKSSCDANPCGHATQQGITTISCGWLWCTCIRHCTTCAVN